MSFSFDIHDQYISCNVFTTLVNLDWSKLKTFAHYIRKVAHMTKFVLERVENIVLKGESAV